MFVLAKAAAWEAQSCLALRRSSNSFPDPMKRRSI